MIMRSFSFDIKVLHSCTPLSQPGAPHFREINICLERFVIDSSIRYSEMVARQDITSRSRKSCLVIDKQSPKLHAFGVFDSIIALISEAEAIYATAVFIGNDFGLCVNIPASIGGVPHFIISVL